MTSTYQRELNEHLDATLMVAPPDILDGLKDADTSRRHRAVEWVADHLGWRLRHYDILLVKASALVSDDSAPEFDRADDCGLELQDYVD